MLKTRAAKLGAGLAAAALAVLLVVDVATRNGDVALAPLFALSPLIASAVLPAIPTAGFGIAATLSATLSALWNVSASSPQQVVSVVDVALVSAAAVVIAAVRVRRERRFGRVAAIAEVAQKAILPTLPMHARRVNVAVRYLSASRDAMVGGDLYDCYHSRTHTRFLIGDVRGKGIGAVEQAARVIRAFRQAAAIQTDLAAVADDMSSYLEPFFDEEEFVTALLVDTTEASRLRIVSAGHPPPVLVRNGETVLLDSPPGVPLGLGHGYRERTVTWTPEDRLLLYTDGLSEARNHSGDFFPLHDLAPSLSAQPLDGALDRLLSVVRRHVTDGNLSDDMALLLLEHAATEQEYRPLEQEHDWRSSLIR